MLAEERFASILEILSNKQVVTVTELSEMTGASEATIRRDLILLDKQGKLKKIHGGAAAVNGQFITIERTSAVKSTLNVNEKLLIAEYAASQVHDDDFVYLDAGTTTLAMVEFLADSKATFVTNGISQAMTLAEKGLKAYVVGGQLKSGTEAIVGAQALDGLSQFNFTKAFIGANGISKLQGYTTPDVEEAKLKAKAMERSYISYILADSSKFDKIFAVTIAPLDRACIITNHIPDRSYSDIAIIKEVKK